jgi:integrase
MRLDVWLDAFMLDVPKRDAFYVRTFAQWRVFRGLRGKIEREKATDASMKWAQIRVRTAAQFLSWLAERETDITHCTQAIVDLWLTESDVVTPYIVRDFVRWATKRGFAKRLDVPRRTRKSAVEPMDEDQRWSDIDRLLAASNLSHDVRLIALLALIFAQQISRVCTLTIEHVREGPDGVFVRFGKDPIEMPPILAQVVAEQVKSARTNPKAKRLDGKRWLFPGQHYGEHVTPDALGRRLSAIGVRSRPARNAALMSFAAELNPGIIATAFNLHVNTATLWAVHAGATYNRHVARCVEDDALEDNPSSPPPAFKKPKRRAARA